MGKNLKRWLFNTIFKKEANDMIKLYEEEIEKLEKENRMMTLIVGGFKVYGK